MKEGKPTKKCVIYSKCLFLFTLTILALNSDILNGNKNDFSTVIKNEKPFSQEVEDMIFDYCTAVHVIL